MAKQSSGEAKVPVIVALVIFILSTLTLGVLLYMAEDRIAQANSSASDAKKKGDEAVNKLRQNEEKILVYKAMIGVLKQDDVKPLLDIKGAGEARSEYETIIKEVNNRLTELAARERADANVKDLKLDPLTPDQVLRWNWPAASSPTGTPDRSLLAGLVASYARQQIAVQRAKNELAEMETAKNSFLESSKNAKAAEQNFNNEAKNFPPAINKVKTDAENENQRVKQSMDLFVKDHEAKLEKTEIERNDNRRQAAHYSRQAREMAAKLEKLEGEQVSKENPLVFDNPHGKITGRRENVVFLNLGSADVVRVGLTFAVQPSDAPEQGLQSRLRPQRKPDGTIRSDGAGKPLYDYVAKGTIEVIEVVGPNSSIARINSEDDPIREAIMVGDVLYNAAWRKGSPDHVALYGVFDVDGDGVDDIKNVVRDLEKAGVKVDAYYDLEKRAWVGKMDKYTLYAVEGLFPKSADAVDSGREAKAEVTKVLNAAKDFAKSQGVRSVSYRDFFPRVGYNFRVDTRDEVVNKAFAKYFLSRPAAVPEQPEK